MRVLAVDDDPLALEMLEAVLTQFGYEVAVACNGQEAMEHFRSGLYRLVISDWQMPEMDGIELCKAIRARSTGGYTYFMMLTSKSGTASIVEGLDAGADEFLTKPLQPQELLMRLRVAERLLNLESRDVTIFSLAKLAESRDPETGKHLERMREYSRVIANHLSLVAKYSGIVDGGYAQQIYLTAPLHDIGKVGIPDEILLKPDRLTVEEFEVMKTHTVIGGETLDASAKAHPEAEYLRMARDIAYSHHEKYDGSGYPYGLAADDIPLCGRIVALADVYDALTTRRVYKPAYCHDVAKTIILEGSGTHFDPDIIQAFIANEDRFVQIKSKFEERSENQAPEDPSVTVGTLQDVPSWVDGKEPKLKPNRVNNR